MAYYKLSSAEVRVGYEATPGVSPVDGYLLNTKVFGITASRDSAVRALLNADAVVAKSSLGGRTVGGSIEIPVQPKMLGVFLYSLLGAPVTTGSGDFEHTFTPTIADQTSLTIEVKLATGEYIRATGVKIGNMTVNPTAASTNLTVVFDLVGMDADGTQTSSFLSGTETDLTGETDFLDHFGAEYSGGSTFCPPSWTFNCERPLTARNCLDGTANASVIFEGKFQPNGSVSMFGETTNTQAILTKARNHTDDNLTLTVADGATKGVDFVMGTVNWIESLVTVDADVTESELSMDYTAHSSFTVVLRNQEAVYPIT